MKLLFILTLAVSSFAHAQWVYPVAKKIPQVETRFGALIEDSYKWMENSSDPDLWDWIDQQKELTSATLDANVLDAFAARVLEIRKIQKEQNDITNAASTVAPRPVTPWDEEDLSSFGRKESRFIKWETTETGMKSNEVKAESATYKIEVKAVASGDLLRVAIMQKADNKLVDVLMVKFYSFITWADDNSFYYVSDMDERIGGGTPGLFKHTVGEVQSEDKLLFRGKSSSSYLTLHQVGKRFFAEVDGVVSSIQLASGKISNSFAVKGEIVEMIEAPEFEAIVLTFTNANFGQFEKLRLRDGQRSLFVKEQDFVLATSKKLNDDASLVIGLKDGSHVAGIYSAATQSMNMLPLNDGTITFASFKDDLLKLTHETFSTPRKVYSYQLSSGKLDVLASQSFPIEVEAEKVIYTATNGQPAAMWVMKKKGLKLTSKTPTILFGYGGFRVAITPSFGIYESMSWMEKGGVYVVVTLPGSLDYGNSWYEVARVGGRTHAWDSFALAAKELYRLGYTSADHCGIMGASNGGTLTAGTLQRHSDVFKAAVPLVGVMDLFNFTLFTAGKYWTEDYGNPFKENDFKAMLPLSPYHNIEKRDYPATMVMTAEFDDRVVPMHSYKYLAKLQEFNTSDAPILLYNKEWGAHGRTSGSARESSRYVSAYFTFFAQQLGL
jgi:prolyl oligopeptidase